MERIIKLQIKLTELQAAFSFPNGEKFGNEHFHTIQSADSTTIFYHSIGGSHFTHRQFVPWQKLQVILIDNLSPVNRSVTSLSLTSYSSLSQHWRWQGHEIA